MMTKLLRYLHNGTFLKFALVGILNTLIDVGVLAFLVYISGVDPATSPLLFVFVTIAFLCAVINGFILNKLWTFRLRTRRHTTRQFIKFFLTNLVGLALTMGLMYVLVQILTLLVVPAKLLTSLVVLMWNFLATKHWTFRERRLAQVFHHHEEGAVDVSVIIPAYNEEKRLGPTLAAVTAYMETLPTTYELLVVDDGSMDSTAAVVLEWSIRVPAIRLVSLPVNQGKGAAVRAGVSEAKGKWIVFTDADNSTPIDELGRFWQQRECADVLIGSRYLRTSSVDIKQPWYRILLSRAANLVIRVVLIDGVRDTQCGFKLFRHDVAKDIFSRMTIDGFGFDMELLALADVLAYRVQELPVRWMDAPDSRVRPLKAAWKTLGDLMVIKLNIWTGKYRIDA